MGNKLVNLIEPKLGCGYVWGSQGQTLTPELLSSFIKLFGKEYYDFGAVKASKWMGKQVFDCSGLIVWALQQLKLISPKQDYTAGGLINSLCTPITKNELQPGDLVAISRPNGTCSHIGVYVGNNQVVHAQSTSKGVVKTSLFSAFDKFGRLKFDLNDGHAPQVPYEQQTINLLKQHKVAFDEQYWQKVFEGKEQPNARFIQLLVRRCLNEKE